MRKITLGSILVFNCLLILAIVIALFATKFLFLRLPLGDFTGVFYTFVFIILSYLVSIFIYRLFLYFFPLREGEIQEKSKEEFISNIYLLFYLIPFPLLIKNKLLPVPLMRIIYLMLGAKLGDNTYSVGTILDPPLTFVGSNTILGQDCILVSHVIEGKKLRFASIHIGNNVTVGANAVIMSGVVIEDNAIVAAGAVVKKGELIKAKEVWGGVPAKKIRILH